MELKPCPFCGGMARAVIYHNREYTRISHYVKCELCDVHTPNYVQREIAIKAWNRRAEDGK